MPQVYIPEPGVYVQTAASAEYPGGQVVHLLPGWNELDPTMAKNPVLAGLVPEDDAAQKRRFQIYQAQQAQAEATSKAQVEYTTEAIKVENEALEAMRKAEEERAKRVEEDKKRGVTRTEPHPDPEAQHAVAITQVPGAHTMVSAAGMVGRAEPLPAPTPPNVIDNTLPPEGEGGAARGGRRTTV